MQFSNPVTAVEFLTPLSAASLLFTGMALILYLFFRTKRKVYLIISIITLLALIFITSMGLVTIIGGLYFNEKLSMQIYRIGQSSVTLLLVFIFPYCSLTLTLSPALRKALNIMTIVNIIFATIAIIITFAAPDLFLSVTKQNDFAFTYTRQSMWGRGQSGIVYILREVINGITLIIMLSVTFYEIIINKLLKKTIFITIGLIFFIFTAIEDLYSFQTNQYIIMPDILFSRFSIGITVFTSLIIIDIFKYFISNAIAAKKTKVELESRYDKNNIFMNTVTTFSKKISLVSNDLNQTSNSLQNVAETTIDTLVVTKEHSNRLSESSKEFSTIANIQKNHIDEIITFITMLFNSLKDIRKNINNQKNKISETIEYTGKLTYTIDSMNDAMKQIMNISSNIKQYTLDRRQSIIEAFKKFEDIASITDEIFKSIEFIKDIAHKTNLLSINSGIQASKAGHFGRGFSVLSREIRTLATNTHMGTEEVENLLIDIANTLEDVSNIKGYVLDSFDLIIDHVNETTKTIDEIIEYMKDQTEKNEIIKLDIQMLDASTEVIDSSIKTQDEDTIYVQGTMNTIFKNFEKISARSLVQIADIRSINTDVVKLNQIGNLLNDYSKGIGEYTVVIDEQNKTLRKILSRFDIIKNVSLNNISMYDSKKKQVKYDKNKLAASGKSIEDLFIADANELDTKDLENINLYNTNLYNTNLEEDNTKDLEDTNLYNTNLEKEGIILEEITSEKNNEQGLTLEHILNIEQDNLDNDTVYENEDNDPKHLTSMLKEFIDESENNNENKIKNIEDITEIGDALEDLFSEENNNKK